LFYSDVDMIKRCCYCWISGKCKVLIWLYHSTTFNSISERCTIGHFSNIIITYYACLEAQSTFIVRYVIWLWVMWTVWCNTGWM